MTVLKPGVKAPDFSLSATPDQKVFRPERAPGFFGSGAEKSA
jgi:hypothetical protein